MIDSTKLIAYFVARKQVVSEREIIDTDTETIDDGIGEEFDIEITDGTIIED